MTFCVQLYALYICTVFMHDIFVLQYMALCNTMHDIFENTAIGSATIQDRRTLVTVQFGEAPVYCLTMSTGSTASAAASGN